MAGTFDSQPTPPGPCPDGGTFLNVAPGQPCAFATISDAIDAARKANAHDLTIYVVPGTYSRETGERFPLDLRGGLSLEGTDTNQRSIIVGAGEASHALEGGSMPSTFRATILTGSLGSSSAIRNVEIVANEPIDRNTFGIFCDRGNASDTLPEPEPKLIVDRVRVGAAYGVGIFVSNSTTPKSGCNARITRTTVATENLIGIQSGGCDGSPASAVMAVDVGGVSPDDGNEFDSVGANETHAAVMLSPCTAMASVRNNSFFSSGANGAGVIVDQKGTASNVTILGNSFHGQPGGGVHLLTGKIDELSGNEFRGCGNAAVWIEGPGLGIAHARNNTFVGNRTGVTIWATAGLYDFGTDASPGGNDFRCNSILSGEAGFGYDAGFAFVPVGVTLLFAGNRWDHVPPTLSIGDDINGADVVESATGAVPLLSGASQSALSCPGANIP